MFRLVYLTTLIACVFGASVPASTRIVGGIPIEITDAPWQVGLDYQGFHRCGGVLIYPSKVLTTAACVNGIDQDQLIIRAGTTYMTGGYSVPVSYIAIHPDYDAETAHADVAVVSMNFALEEYELIMVMEMAPTGLPLPVGELGAISGWGMTVEDGPASDQLMGAQVEIVDQDACVAAYADYTRQITDTMFCAGNLEGGADGCDGDAGGGLIVNDQVIGLVSWGVGCGRPGYPGVYTKIAQLRPWINDQLV